MSLVTLSQYPGELQYKLLDWMDADGLCAMKKMHRANLNDFESDSIVYYLLHDRLPRLIEQAKPHARGSEQHQACVRQFVKVVSLLPADVKSPTHDSPSPLRSLMSDLCQVVSHSAVRQRLLPIAKIKDKKIKSFLSCVPTEAMPHTKKGWAELSRRFSEPGIDQSEFIKRLEFVDSTKSDEEAYDFIKGVSVELLQALLNDSVAGFDIHRSLIRGLRRLQNENGLSKLIILAQCFQNYDKYISQNRYRYDPSYLSGPHQASSIMYILYLSTTMPRRLIDREMVKSWIPEHYLNDWDFFEENAIRSGTDPFCITRVKERLGDLFTQER